MICRILLLALLLPAALGAQQNPLYVTRAVKQGKWALLDGGGKRITEFNYDYISDFQGPFAVFEQNAYEGAMDYKGRLRLEPKFEVVEFLYDEGAGSTVPGVARVMLEDKWGLASLRSGRTLIEPKFAYVNPYSEGLAFVNEGGRWIMRNGAEAFEGGRWGLADTSGHLLLPPTFQEVMPFRNGLAEVVQNGKWGILDKTGHFTVQPTYEQLEALELTFSGKPLLQTTLNGQIGWMARDNSFTAAPQFEDVLWPTDATGLVAVKKGGLWGFADFQGKLLVPCQYNSTLGFRGRQAVVEQNRKYGLINATGQLVQPLEAQGVIDFGRRVLLTQAPVFTVGQHVGSLVAARTADKWGLLGADGKLRIPATFDYLEPLFPNAVKAQQGSLWGMLDSTGREILPFQYEDVKLLNEKLACALKEGKWTLLKPNGTPASDRLFERVNDFGFGLLEYQEGDFTGLLRSDGTLLLPAAYDEVSDLGGHLIVLHKAGQYAVADTQGKILSTKLYDELLPASFGVVPVRQGDKWGLLGLNGQEILAPKLGTIEPIAPNRLRVATASNDFRLYDFQGATVGTYAFQELLFFTGNVAPVKMYGKWGLLRMDGTLVTAPEFEAVEPFQAIKP